MSALETLADRLKVPADQLTALKGYDEAQVEKVSAVVTEAFEAEDRAFAQAVEESLGFLPRLIRPLAKKMMLGG